MTKLENPVLPGFHPDPSICRVGNDYYIATSTFEWFPGVRLHHSKDLKNWNPVGYALDRVSQLDMRGCQSSAGIWAPCLTYADGLFWLLYTNVRSHSMIDVIDSPNYLVTAESPLGPWSEPIYLNSYGFDPSLFHDEDGRKFVVQMQMGEASSPDDPQFRKKRFDGIILQEFDPIERQPIGEVSKIWSGSELGITEGPHILKKDGWYYLITAEGGTAFRHAVSVCRSRSLTGDFELCPKNPLLTAFQRPEAPLAASGHGSIVDSSSGEWFLAHLCSRPIQRPGKPVEDRETNKCCPLGRETAIQKIVWNQEGWPELVQGGDIPALSVAVDLPEFQSETPESDILTNSTELPLAFQTLREPVDDSWIRWDRKEGCISLRGRDSLSSNFDQSLIARRLEHLNANAETLIYFTPKHSKQAAGLIVYYDKKHYHYFRLTATGDGRVKLGVVTAEYNKREIYEAACYSLSEIQNGIKLSVRMSGAELQFGYCLAEDDHMIPLERSFDATVCGDWVSPEGGFTGTFWGLCCQDLATRSCWAHFSYFHYAENSAH